MSDSGDYPQDVKITTVQDDAGAAFVVTVNPQDIGLVIGRQGRTIKSIRTILSRTAVKLPRRYAVDIDEADEGHILR
jgi:uncharacterized protein